MPLSNKADADGVPEILFSETGIITIMNALQEAIDLAMKSHPIVMRSSEFKLRKLQRHSTKTCRNNLDNPK